MPPEAIQSASNYANRHASRFLNAFTELLSIPSISTDPGHTAEVQRAAAWIVAELERIGFHNCRAIPSAGHPVVYGEWLEAGPAKPTLLVYAHYDVQPVDPLALWDSPPFEPTIRDGRLYARGAIDDKCGVMINLQAMESILATSGRLPVNVKFFFEGEEETGSPSMADFVREHRDLLAADLLVVSDGGTPDEVPMAFTSLRGLVAAEVEVRGPRRDLHSGSYGGIVQNPAHVVAHIIASVQDDEGQIQIPGYYDRVRPLTAAQREQLKQLELVTLRRARLDTGLESFWGESAHTFLERKTARPTFDVNGLTAGYQQAGTKTIIPSRASFKATMRLVADQDPDDIARRFETYAKRFASETATINVRITAKSPPVEIPLDTPQIAALQRAFEVTWGQHALLYREGGSVPVVGTMQSELGVDIVNLGLGVGSNGHAPNEFYELDYYHRNLEAAIHFYHYLAEPNGNG